MKPIHKLRKFGVRGTAVLGASVLLAPAIMARADGLTGAGATFPYPIYLKWFDVYNQRTGVQINYQAIGSGGGITQLKSGTVDFGASDAALSDKDLHSMPGQIVHIPTVAGAVVLSYNLPGKPRLKLTAGAIAGIFLGTIARWNDPRIAGLNPGVALPGTAITIAHRSDGSGTTNIFTTYLKTVSPAWADKVGSGKTVAWPVGIGGKGNDGVAGIISQTPGAIGYIELAYAVNNHLPYASVRNRDGHYIEPSVASVTAAAVGATAALKRDVRTPIVNSAGPRAYPISGFTYILVYTHQRDAAKGRELLRFLHWAIGPQAQQMAATLFYAPLPGSVAAIDEAKLATVK